MDVKKKNTNKLHTYWTILKNTVSGFMNEDSMKYSASLSYYTVFSIGPILVLIISLAGIFYGAEAIEGIQSIRSGMCVPNPKKDGSR